MPEREEARKIVNAWVKANDSLIGSLCDLAERVAAALKSAQATPTTKQITDSPTYQRLDAYRLELERDLAQAREDHRLTLENNVLARNTIARLRAALAEVREQQARLGRILRDADRGNYTVADYRYHVKQMLEILASIEGQGSRDE